MSAEYRSVQTRMWREDDWFQQQPTDARLLFIYLFTNPSASVSGIYRLPLRTIEFESGLSAKRVKELLAQFSADNKVHYEDGVVWVVKMRDNQLPGRTLSEKIKTHLDGEIAKIPPCRLKNQYLIAYGYSLDGSGYPIDTLSIPMCTETDTYTDTKPETETETETIAPVSATHRTKPSSAHQDMFGAIAATCELDAAIHNRKIGQTAKTLLAAGYTPEQVRQFKAWWQSDTWRYEHTPVPSLKALLDKIQHFKNSADRPRPVAATPHTNGHVNGTSKVAQSLAAIDRVFDMLEGEGA